MSIDPTEFYIKRAEKQRDLLLRPKEAARLLGLSIHTLAVWRHRGDHRLTFVKFSPRAVRYRLSDVEKFIESNQKNAAPEMAPVPPP